METNDVLNQAADYLQEHGWIQGGLGKPGGPRCAMGALKSVLGETSVIEFVAYPPYRALRRHVGGFVSDWNDAPERTADQVIATLRAAAVIAESRETVAEPATEAATR